MSYGSISEVKYLKLYFIKSNIFTFSDIKLYLFSTVLYATFKTHSKACPTRSREHVI